MSTVTLASKRSWAGSIPSISERTHLTMWCSSSDSRTMSSTLSSFSTASRIAG
jgi:hypothetical protein